MAKKPPPEPLPVTALSVKDLLPDGANRRQRTPRGAQMLVESFEHVGAARSIVIDEDNGVLAGNGALEAAAEAGIRKVQVIETDGQTLVAVRRRGLSAEDKRALAMYDNRTGELAEWNDEQLVDDHRQGFGLAPWFNEAEQRRHLRDKATKQAKVRELDTSDVDDQFWIAIRGPLPVQAAALQRVRELLKDFKVEVEIGLTTPGATVEPWETPEPATKEPA